MTRSTSEATFHPNKLHLFSCLSIYTSGSAGEMKSAANKSYNSALANASLGLNYPKVTKGLCWKTGLLRIIYRTGHRTFKWNYYCVEAWDSLPWKTKSPSCHKTRAGQAGRSLLSIYFNFGLAEGWNPGSVPSPPSLPRYAFQQDRSLFQMQFQLWIAVRWEQSQSLLTSAGFKTAAETQNAFYSSCPSATQTSES